MELVNLTLDEFDKYSPEFDTLWLKMFVQVL